MTETVTLTSGLALLLGLLHALEPGHGKTALMTYLASGKRTLGEGVFIALTSAITHSLAVMVIALGSHYFLHAGTHEGSVHAIGSTLALVSGALIMGLGVWILFRRESEDSHHSCAACSVLESHYHKHDHDHDHSHGHSHSHSHKHDHGSQSSAPKSTAKSFLASGLLGVATGIVPCPTVVVAYLSGFSSGNSFVGLQNVFLFAVGMSISLLAFIILFNMGALKVRDKISFDFIPFKWNHVQGVVFILIGLFTALYH